MSYCSLVKENNQEQTHSKIRTQRHRAYGVAKSTTIACWQYKFLQPALFVQAGCVFLKEIIVNNFKC